MPATPEATRLAEAHRRAQIRIAARVALRMQQVWPLLDAADLDGTFSRWLIAVQGIVGGGRAESARLAANYLTLFKRVELGAAAAPPPVVLAEAVTAAALEASMRVTGPVAVKSSVRKGRSVERAMHVASQRAAGAAMRHVLDGSRQTILATVDADPDALGWARQTSGNTCAFCAMLASRGPVYKSERTADFKPHDNCFCEPVPVYRREGAWPPGSRYFRDLWQQAKQHEGDTALVFRRLVETRNL